MSISQIDQTSPAEGDFVSGGATEIQQLKRDVKGSFPAFASNNDIVTRSALQLNNAPDKTAAERINGQWNFDLPPTFGPTTILFALLVDITYAHLNQNGSVGPGANQVAQGTHGHTASQISDFAAAVEALLTWANLSGLAGFTNTSFAYGDHTHPSAAITDLIPTIDARIAANPSGTNSYGALYGLASFVGSGAADDIGSSWSATGGPSNLGPDISYVTGVGGGFTINTTGVYRLTVTGALAASASDSGSRTVSLNWYHAGVAIAGSIVHSLLFNDGVEGASLQIHHTAIVALTAGWTINFLQNSTNGATFTGSGVVAYIERIS